MDLRLPTQDRDARNESSYRPDGLLGPRRLDPHKTLELTREIWSALEPSQPSCFEQIDRHILRLAVEAIFLGLYGTRPPKDRSRFRQITTKIVANQGLSPDAARHWRDYLCRRVSPRDLGVFAASRIHPGNKRCSHAGTIARATLLLRVASGSAGMLLQTAGFTPEAIEFWWEGIGVSRGLWEGVRGLDRPTDLWADIEAFMDDLSAFNEAHPASEQTFFRLGQELASTIVGLGSCERVALWSLTPA